MYKIKHTHSIQDNLLQEPCSSQSWGFPLEPAIGESNPAVWCSTHSQFCSGCLCYIHHEKWRKTMKHIHRALKPKILQSHLWIHDLQNTSVSTHTLRDAFENSTLGGSMGIERALETAVEALCSYTYPSIKSHRNWATLKAPPILSTDVLVIHKEETEKGNT